MRCKGSTRLGYFNRFESRSGHLGHRRMTEELSYRLDPVAGEADPPEPNDVIRYEGGQWVVDSKTDRKCPGDPRHVNGGRVGVRIGPLW